MTTEYCVLVTLVTALIAHEVPVTVNEELFGSANSASLRFKVKVSVAALVGPTGALKLTTEGAVTSGMVTVVLAEPPRAVCALNAVSVMLKVDALVRLATNDAPSATVPIALIVQTLELLWVTVIAEMLLKFRSTPFTVESELQSIALLPVIENESPLVVDVAADAASVSVGGTPSIAITPVARKTSVAWSPIAFEPNSML